MSKVFKDYSPSKTYSYWELEKFKRTKNEKLKKLVESGKATTIARFFAEHKELQKTLRETSILGYPSNVIFSSKNICNGLCNQTSVLFACACGIEGVKVSTALDKEIAFLGYKDYLKDWRIAHHTWVEFEIDGKEKVLDFTEQIAFDKNDYYQLKMIDENQIMKKSLNKVMLQELVNVSFVEIGRRIYEMISYPFSLLQSYEHMKYYNILNRDSDFEGYEYLEQELDLVKKKLEKREFSKDYLSPVFILIDAIDYNDSYREIVNKTIKKYLEDNKEGVFDRNFDGDVKRNYKDEKILKEVFPQTKNMEKLIYESCQGPRENFDKTYEDLGI